MRQSLRSRLTYANVISTLCLFLLLGGGTAVALDGSNTVFTDDIVNNQVRSDDVRDDNLTSGGLTAADLRNDSVGSSEVANGSIGSSDLASEAVGAYGHVSQIGTLSRAKNVKSVTHPSTGHWCIALAGIKDLDSRVLIVATDNSNSGTSTVNSPFGENFPIVQWKRNSTCPAGTLEVVTFLYDGDYHDNINISDIGDDLSYADEPFAFVVP